MKVYKKEQYGKTFEILLDDEDYDRVVSLNRTLIVHKSMRHKQKDIYYVRFSLNSKKVLLHRWIMNCPPDKVVDHINHNPLDNRKHNLRICSSAENLRNKANNKTGYNGVSWIERDRTYRATIYVNGKLIHLGQSKNLQEMVKLRKQAEKRYFQ